MRFFYSLFHLVTFLTSTDTANKYYFPGVTSLIRIAESGDWCRVNNKQMALLIKSFSNENFDVEELFKRCSEYWPIPIAKNETNSIWNKIFN